MDIIHQILSTYASFFDWKMWGEVLTDPVAWGYIGTLVILEGLLSADNALVLAVMVRHLPKKQQKKALTYGLFGAYFFRVLFIGLGVYLIKFWWIKLIGAGYLAWLVIQYFWKGEDDDDAGAVNKNGWAARVFGLFWATVISVEIMDLAFSVDSILAAFAVSEEVWILFLGGALGILMMRTVARVFLVLIDKVPELETTAYVLIGIIAIKMGLSTFGVHIHHLLFFGVLIAAFLITFIIHYYNTKNGKHESDSLKEVAASKEK